MEPTDDGTLLRQYAENNSDEAFVALVTRHVNLVYSVALRQVGNPHSAEEITQAVFIILAKKASSFRNDKALSSWLFQATRLTANNFLRSEMRRQHREQEAHDMQTILNEPESELWPGIAPLLDTAVANLKEKDRRAILLRFYEGKNLREVGNVLGASEAATEKRVNRALEKLRKFFTKRGVSSTTEIIAGTISANSVQAAPVALAKSVTAVAIANGATASVSTLTLIKGALKTMAWTKAKAAIVIGVGILLAAGTTTVIVKKISNDWINDPRYWKNDSSVLAKNPPAIILRPTRGYDSRVSCLIDSGSVTGSDFRVEYKNVPFNVLLGAAYNYDNNRIWQKNGPRGNFDYMFTLSGGYKKAYDSLKTEIKKQYGLVGHVETRETDVLLVKVASPNAPGFKMVRGEKDASLGRFQYAPDISKYAVFSGASINSLALWLEDIYKMPVLNETGLTNVYDFTVKWKPRPGQSDESAVREVMLNQFGLELVSSRRPIEMLVVEKAQ